ncbi:serine/threonine protein kinase [Oscillatoria salina]|uniref:serine/threonine protein kinase n=1 Tax=Oscillatoria salina TaxID=331517 RepID=UPI001CCAE239|nr:serine/threonine-protein kinase [Oscillatoria salina]
MWGTTVFASNQILQTRYQLEKQLGHTAAGRQTWLALDNQSGEQVTLKLLAFSPQMQWEELKLFEREAQVLQALSHPRIPRYRDYFSLGKEAGAGLCWFGLVQDYIPGVSVQELLTQGQRFTEAQVRSVAVQVLEILIYLHELSPPVLHRDIKPSNLIWGEDESVYLVDFGAVQAQAAVTGVTFTVVGTSGYAPLEQFWGRAVAASDLYALGATLIHLLTGIAPAELPHQDSRIQFRHLVSIDSSFLVWIEKVTESAIEKRYPTARRALEILQSGLVEPTHNTRRISALRKLHRPVGTYIKLEKSPQSLQIDIPAGGFRKLTIYGALGAFFLLYLGSSFFFLSITLLLTAPTFGLLFTIILVGFFAKFMGERTRISFQGSRFGLERQTLWFRYGQQTGYIGEIFNVLVYKQGEVYEVMIRSAAKNYRLGGALGEHESAWLAQEIQDWLRGS